MNTYGVKKDSTSSFDFLANQAHSSAATARHVTIDIHINIHVTVRRHECLLLAD